METFGKQTFSFEAILKESFFISEDALNKRQPSSGEAIKPECTSREDFVNQHTDQPEMSVSTVDSSSERQSLPENAKQNPWTKASSTPEDASVSIADDQSFQNQGSLDDSTKKRNAAIAGLEDLVVSYTRLSENTASIFKDISHTMVADYENLTSSNKSSTANAKPNPTLEDASVSITEDQGSLPNSTEKRDAAMVGLEDLVISYTRLSENAPCMFKDISYTIADPEEPTSCSLDYSASDEMTSILENVSGTSKKAFRLDKNNQTSHQSIEQFKQPPRKKIKLDKRLKIPVRDVLTGAHTKLCKTDCTLKHNPFDLAICAPDYYKLKSCMENHLKLAMKGAWTLNPKIINGMHRLVHLAVLFGKNNLLECLLKVCLDRTEFYVDSNQNSPLHTVMKSMHKYMPSSSHLEKVTTLQCMLQLLAKYNCKILLVRDKANEDTVLHVCAKQIRKRTNQLKSIESLGHDGVNPQALLNQRQLLEGIYKELIHTFKRLCDDGSLLHSQVTELIDCANNAGETNSQILQEDERERKNSTVLACSEVTSTVPDEGNARGTKQQRVHQNHSEGAITDKSTPQSSTTNEISSTCTIQNDNAEASNQITNPKEMSVCHTKRPSVQAAMSVSMRPTQAVVSTQAENYIGTITLPTNCPSVPLSTLTTVSPSVRMTQAVESTSQAGNLMGNISLPTNCLSVQETSNGCQNPSASTTVSASLQIPPSVLSTKAAHPVCASVQTPNGHQNPNTSTAVCASLPIPKTVVSTKMVHSGYQSQDATTTATASLWIPPSFVPTQAAHSGCTSVRTPNGHQNPNALTTVSPSLWVPPFPLASGEWPKQSTSTTASARIAPTQVANSTGTTTFSANHSSVEASNQHQNPKASSTVSASLWIPPSPLAPSGWSKQSTSTTASVSMVPTEVANSSGHPNASTAASASIMMPKSVVPQQVAHSVGPSAQRPSRPQNLNSSTTVTASIQIPPSFVPMQASPSLYPSALSHSGHQLPNASTTVPAPLRMPQRFVSNQVAYPVFPLVLPPSGGQNPNASAIVTASSWIPPSFVPTKGAHPVCPPVLTPSGRPNFNATVTVTAPLWIPPSFVPTQMAHSVWSSFLTPNGYQPLWIPPSFVPIQAAHSLCPSVQTSNGHQNRNASSTVSASLWVPPSPLAPNGWSKQSSSTTSSVSVVPAQVANSSGHQNLNASATVSSPLQIPPSVVSTQVLRPVCLSVQTPNGLQNQNTSTTVCAPLQIPKTVVSTQIAHSVNGHQSHDATTTSTASLSTPARFVPTQDAHSVCPSVQVSNGHQNHNASTTVPVSTQVPPSPVASNEWPKGSTPTTASAKIVPTQVENSSGTTTFSTNHLSVKTSNVHQNPKASSTVSASLWVPPSPLAPSGWSKQSTSTTTSVSMVPVKVANSSGHQNPNASTAVSASTWVPPFPVASSECTKKSTSTTASAMTVPTQVTNSTGNKTFSTNHLSTEASNVHQNPNASTTVSASLWVPPSPLAPNGWSKQSTSTTSSVTLAPAEVANPSGHQNPNASTAVSASTWGPFSLASSEWPKQFTSTTASAMTVPTQVANSTGTTTFSTNHLSTEASNVNQNPNPSTTVSASLWVPPSPLTPNGWPKQSTLTATSVSIVPVEVVNSSGHENPNASTADSASTWVPTFSLASSEWPKQSTSTTASERIVPTQVANSTGTTTFSTNHLSTEASKVHQNPNASTTVSASLWVPPSPLAPNGWSKQSTSTATSVSIVPAEVANSSGHQNSNASTADPASTWVQPFPLASSEWPKQSTSTTASERIVPTQVANSTGTTTFSTNHLPTEASNVHQNPNPSSTVSASVWVPPAPLAPNGWSKQSTSTTASVSMAPAEVANSSGHQNPNASTAVSASLRIPKTVVLPQAVHSVCPPVQTPNGHENLTTSTTVCASLPIPKTVVSTQMAHSVNRYQSHYATTTVTASLSTPERFLAHSACPSVQMPNGHQKHNASTTVPASMWVLPSSLVSNEWPKQSASTTASSRIVPTQVANSSGTTIFSTNHLSVQASSECPGQSTSTTVSMSANPRAQFTETLTHFSDMPTMQINAEKQQLRKGKHTFLCKPDCHLRHHKLVQLLCATPDHLSTDTPVAEIESCTKLRLFIRHGKWAMPDVVPAHVPCLRLPIVHLACFLGKHKALEVLAEFPFHPLAHTAETEATPLHMTVRLLRHQTSHTIFLSEVVVSILKTLNRHSHAISLFSAKDNKGNSVLHALAELISSKVPESATLLYVYLFRVFVHFLLKGQVGIPLAELLQILSSCLKDCNKAGEDVESLLQKSIPGQQLLEYLTGLIQRGVQVKEASNETQAVENGKEKFDGLEGEYIRYAFGEHNETRTEMGAHLMSEEPKSLVDFLLSADCTISIDSKKRIMEYYIAEYSNRMQLISAKMAAVKEELMVPTLLQRKTAAHEELKKIEKELKWYWKKMKLKESELKQMKGRMPSNVKELRDKLQLIDKLTHKFPPDF